MNTTESIKEEQSFAMPRIGDKAPEFTAVTTQGDINYPSDYKGKWSIVLGLTSNKGAKDIELLKLQDGRYVFEAAMEATAKLGSSEQIMFVVGATQTEYLGRIRKVAPDHFLLIPGVGAQGGKLKDLQVLMTSEVGVLVNSSRQIIYASSGKDFAEASAIEAEKLQVQMGDMIT